MDGYLKIRPRQTAVSAWFGSFAVMTIKELRIMSRYPLEFAAGFIQAFLIMAVVVFSSLTFTPPGGASEERLLVSGILVYGFVLFIFVTEIVWNMGYNLRKEQRQGTLEQLYLTPTATSVMLFSRLTISLLWTSFLCILALGAIVALTGSLPLANPLPALLIFLFSIASICGIGLILAALSFFIKEGSQTVATIVQFGFIVVCAPFFPFSALPRWAVQLSRLAPLSYCVDSFRTVLMNYPSGYPELASLQVEIPIIVASGVLLPLLGIRMFHWAERRARHAGTLSAY